MEKKFTRNDWVEVIISVFILPCLFGLIAFLHFGIRAMATHIGGTATSMVVGLTSLALLSAFVGYTRYRVLKDAEGDS